MQKLQRNLREFCAEKIQPSLVEELSAAKGDGNSDSQSSHDFTILDIAHAEVLEITVAVDDGPCKSGKLASERRRVNAPTLAYDDAATEMPFHIFDGFGNCLVRDMQLL